MSVLFWINPVVAILCAKTQSPDIIVCALKVFVQILIPNPDVFNATLRYLAPPISIVQTMLSVWMDSVSVRMVSSRMDQCV